ncbi:MAG: hypothetical protein AB7N54_15395 [Alphaproteobacteria bacterium]
MTRPARHRSKPATASALRRAVAALAILSIGLLLALPFAQQRAASAAGTLFICTPAGIIAVATDAARDAPEDGEERSSSCPASLIGKIVPMAGCGAVAEVSWPRPASDAYPPCAADALLPPCQARPNDQTRAPPADA